MSGQRTLREVSEVRTSVDTYLRRAMTYSDKGDILETEREIKEAYGVVDEFRDHNPDHPLVNQLNAQISRVTEHL